MSSRQPSSEKCQVGAVFGSIACRTQESDSASAMGMSVAIGKGEGFHTSKTTDNVEEKVLP